MQYYYQENSVQKGPVDIDTLKNANITPETYVWHEGMSNWQKAKELPELAVLFNSQRPPISGYSNTESTANPPHANPVFCPSTNLIWGILVTIFCCIPFGIVSIIYASKVERTFYAGNSTEAYRYSKLARNWAIAGAISSIVLFLLWITFIAIGAGMDIFQSYIEETLRDLRYT